MERDEINRRVAQLLASADEGAQQQLPIALAQLKANLSAEMRAWSEQHFLLFRMLLSPTQVNLSCNSIILFMCWPLLVKICCLLVACSITTHICICCMSSSMQ